MTTIHSFTGDQRTVDTLHSDLARARTASQNIIPTSTGAARAVGLVLPELQGKLDGTAIRVPTPNVSLIDLTFTSKRKTSVEEINDAIVKAAKGKLKGVLATNDEPLVSSDYNHHPASSIFDLKETQVIEDRFVRVMKSGNHPDAALLDFAELRDIVGFNDYYDAEQRYSNPRT